ncbi:MAG: hypothetical protein AB8G96_03035 [Phycisphaerales bacterium]
MNERKVSLSSDLSRGEGVARPLGIGRIGLQGIVIGLAIVAFGCSSTQPVLSEADPVGVPGRAAERGLLGSEDRQRVLGVAESLVGGAAVRPGLVDGSGAADGSDGSDVMDGAGRTPRAGRGGDDSASRIGISAGISAWPDAIRVVSEAGDAPGVECVVVDWEADGDDATIELRTVDRRTGRVILRRELRSDGPVAFTVVSATIGRDGAPARPALQRRADRLRAEIERGFVAAQSVPRFASPDGNALPISTPARPFG